MSKIEKDIEVALDSLLEFLVPPGMTAKERNALAMKAGILPETLRLALHRRSMNAETLLRLLLAKGIQPKIFSDLPRKAANLSKGERIWDKLGRSLSDLKKVEYASLIDFMESKWR